MKTPHTKHATPKFTTTLLLTLALTTLATHAPAADFHVPSVYPTIQQAINAASTGDSVVIEPGTYYENININGKNITIKPFNTNFDTIIDGNATGPVITFKGTETNKCTIRNIVIRNGKSGAGAGILGNNSLATIKNCLIGANACTGSGGGIFGHSGLIQNCTITQNTATNGAGISNCDGIIDSCKITLNKASATGGGLYNCEGTIQYCEITNNEASTRGGGANNINANFIANLIANNTVTATGPLNTPTAFGGGLNDMHGTVTLNLITGNTSSGDGGGVANTDALFQNNVLTKNGARRGGAMATSNGRIENNTIWGNTANAIAGGCFNLGPNVANCIIFQNSATNDPQWSGPNIPTYSCIQGWPGSQPDIISADPLLQDPAKGKFDLLPSSPCIDAGRAIPGLTIDYEAEPRPYNGTPDPRGDGSDFDIGADEFVPQNVDYSGSLVDVTTKYKGDIPKLKGSIKGTFLVANLGTDTPEAVALVQFYLSDDTNLDPGDQQVGKTISLKNLKPGKTKKIKCNAKLPLNQVATGKYLIAIADITNTTAETSELNNTSIVGPLP